MSKLSLDSAEARVAKWITRIDETTLRCWYNKAQDSLTDRSSAKIKQVREIRREVTMIKSVETEDS